jgi:hypothetical protein
LYCTRRRHAVSNTDNNCETMTNALYCSQEWRRLHR